MTLHRLLAQNRSRLKKAREFYRINKPWSRTLAWEILEEIAESQPGNYNRKEKLAVAAAIEEQDMRLAFSILGDCAKMSIQDLEVAIQNKYYYER